MHQLASKADKKGILFIQLKYIAQGEKSTNKKNLIHLEKKHIQNSRCTRRNHAKESQRKDMAVSERACYSCGRKNLE